MGKVPLYVCCYIHCQRRKKSGRNGEREIEKERRAKGEEEGRKRRGEVKKDAHYPSACNNVGECNHFSNFPGVP